MSAAGEVENPGVTTMRGTGICAPPKPMMATLFAIRLSAAFTSRSWSATAAGVPFGFERRPIAMRS